MSEIAPSQKTYSLYAGDFQFRTPQDQGPIQNAVFDNGVTPVSIRHLYSDATAPSYVVKLFREAFNDIQQGQSLYPFTGIVGMGDFLDLGCRQEETPLMFSIRQLLATSPELKFVLMARGNHDGGQYMGTVYSLKNFLGLIDDFWSDSREDYQQDICGGRGNTLTISSAIEFFDSLLRGPDHISPFSTIVSQVQTTGPSGYTSQGISFDFKNTKKVFDDLWHKDNHQDRWDAIIYKQEDAPPKNTGVKKSPDQKETDFSNIPGEVNQWIHLQAFKQTEFVVPQKGSVPIYQITLDTQDFTAADDDESSVKGHVSAFQIGVVKNFIDQKLAENPNAKFKIIMHYPFEVMESSSRRALKKLLGHDAVIMLFDAHRHIRRHDQDVSDQFDLDRNTPLPRISVPSTTDETPEIAIEEMSFDVQGTHYTIGLNYTFRGIEEEEIAPVDTHPLVYERLTELELSLTENKRKLYESLAAKEIDIAPLVNQNGEPKYIYLNEDEVIAQLDNSFAKGVANAGDCRISKIWHTLRLWFDYKDKLMNQMTVEASLPQMVLDFETFLIFARHIRDLLVDEGYKDLAVEMDKKISQMENEQMAFTNDFLSFSQTHSGDELSLYNDLYTRTDLDGLFNFINQRLPEESEAKLFAIIAGRRAAQEEAVYHDYSNIRQPAAPDTVIITQKYSFAEQ
ncbi:MAG: hypothetical protein HQM16_14765 [Deltaproteobacteria bacterium]|nr:hypothetical protein [Deltaproteobacteria bacterium]